jgi:hypothetical protein
VAPENWQQFKANQIFKKSGQEMQSRKLARAIAQVQLKQQYW